MCGVAPTQRLPEDAFDRQPLRIRDLTLVGDIRLDTREELRERLGWSLADAQARSDSEFFLAAWSLWGTNALRYLIGGFAVAIWDHAQRELTLVRDHVGERSLYFLQAGQTIAFASLPGPLRAIPGVDTSLDELRIVHALAILPGIAATQTFFKNIQQLPVGHLACFREGGLTLERYWHPLDAPKIHFSKDDDYVEAFRELFDQAVSARMRTTGGVGSQLSGGMDSSSVTATAARLLDKQRLYAFTSVPQPGFADQNPTGRFGDEGPAAAEVAAMYPNIEHFLVRSASEEMIGGVERMGRLQGQPVFNPLNEMWFTAMIKLAREHNVTVILQGACGNATLSAGGIVGLSELFRSGKWLKLARLVYVLRKKGHVSFRDAASFSMGAALPEWMRRRMSPEVASFDFAFSPVHPQQAVDHNLKEKAWEEFFGDDLSPEAFRRQMFDYYDPGFVNVSTTLAWEMELRDPTQDKRIFEYCFAIPIEQYLVGGQSRSLVRRAMHGRLPASTLARTERGLQSADWFLTMGARRKEMAEEMVKIRRSPVANRVLDLDRLQMLLDTWPSAGYEREEVSDAWHLALSRGLSAGNFIRQFDDDLP
jgi:asparagine synthase (glutamine-hydrolysing)